MFVLTCACDTCICVNSMHACMFCVCMYNCVLNIVPIMFVVYSYIHVYMVCIFIHLCSCISLSLERSWRWSSQHQTITEDSFCLAMMAICTSSLVTGAVPGTPLESSAILRTSEFKNLCVVHKHALHHLNSAYHSSPKHCMLQKALCLNKWIYE